MKEITNAIRKTVVSLGETKHRKSLSLFKAEGTKCAIDMMAGFDPVAIFATESWWMEHLTDYSKKDEIGYIVSRQEIQKLSSLTTATDVIAVFQIPKQEFDISILQNKLTLTLDGVQDPGNLGTIIRVADWYGISDIVCSRNTVDCYNPKVIQATMGALSRVKIHYRDLTELLNSLPSDISVFGTFLEGENIYKCELPQNGIIVMGNEGRGVTEGVSKLINRKLFIPPYPIGHVTSESLNVAVATSIVVSEFRRELLKK